MPMKKFINDPANLTSELLEGLTMAYSNKVKLVSAVRSIYQKGILNPHWRFWKSWSTIWLIMKRRFRRLNFFLNPP